MNVLVAGETPESPGVERQWMVSYFPIATKNNDQNMIGIVLIECTDRYQAENKLKENSDLLRAVHEANPDLQFVLDSSGVIDTYHTNNEQDLYLSPSQFIGKKMQNILPTEVGQKFEQAFVKASNTRQLITIEYVLTLDKTQREFEARIVCLEDSRLVVSARDITERKLGELERQKAHRLESLGTLAGGIAHDFNNITTGIFGNISMAKESIKTTDVALSYLTKAEKAMSRATGLSHQLLTFSKGGVPSLERASIDHLLRQTVDFDLSGSNVQPLFEIADNLWMADIDKGQIQQVFSNLTINANQAMASGGHFFVSAENVIIKHEISKLAPGEYLKICFRDQGIGIDQKDLNQIFDPYFTTKDSGSGLGLAIIYSIVSQHKGEIEVHSSLGAGSSFTLYLPASSQPNQAPDKTPTLNPEQPKIAAKILVMDDDEMILDVVTAMLTRKGYLVETALDGAKAIEMYQQAFKPSPFSCMIMDLTIPGGMGGQEAVKEILAFDPLALSLIHI